MNRCVRVMLLLTAIMLLFPPRLLTLESPQSSGALRVYFSPNGGCTRAIVNSVEAAREQVLVQAYELTSAPIQSALLLAHRRGAQLQVIVDPEDLKEGGEVLRALVAGGAQVLVDRAHKPGIAHNKVMVIDRAIVLTGSFNFSKAAEIHNAENLLVISDAAVAATYAANFNVHLAHSSALTDADLTGAEPSYHRRRRYHRWYYRRYW